MSETPVKLPVNPLDEIPLTEVFDKDPQDYTAEDMRRITDRLRAERAKFDLEEKKGKKSKPAAANLSLADLDIKI